MIVLKYKGGCMEFIVPLLVILGLVFKYSFSIEIFEKLFEEFVVNELFNVPNAANNFILLKLFFFIFK